MWSTETITDRPYDPGMPQFRVIYAATSAVRLHDKPADPSSTWTFPWELDGEEAQVIVRDRIDTSRGYPQHLGVEVQVAVHAEDLDRALLLTDGLASAHLTLIATIARGHTGSPQPLLAYEITPEAERRAFRQWHGPLRMPLGKTPVPNPPFGDFFDAYVALRDPSIRYPILMAIQFYGAALREVEPVLRFMLLWLACEAIEDSLRRKLDRTPKDRFWGLKALAERMRQDASLIEDAYELRTDIFHVRGGVDPTAIPARAGALADRLEPLITPGVLLLLDLGELDTHVPSQAASAHPVKLVFSGTMRGDHGTWDVDTHPHVEVAFDVQLVHVEEDGSITYKTPSTFKVHKCVQMSPTSIEVRGPHGPNIGHMALADVHVIRAQDAPTDQPSGSEADEH